MHIPRQLLINISKKNRAPSLNYSLRVALLSPFIDCEKELIPPYNFQIFLAIAYSNSQNKPFSRHINLTDISSMCNAKTWMQLNVMCQNHSRPMYRKTHTQTYKNQHHQHTTEYRKDNHTLCAPTLSPTL